MKKMLLWDLPLWLTYKNQSWGWGSIVEHLPSMPETLDLIPSTAKLKKKIIPKIRD